MLIQKTVLSPTLDGSGQFTQEFGEFANIVSAKVVMTDPFISNTLVRVSGSFTGNVLTMTVEKATTGAWSVASSGNVSGCTFTMTVDGE
jgi:hypothetical protein